MPKVRDESGRHSAPRRGHPAPQSRSRVSARSRPPGRAGRPVHAVPPAHDRRPPLARPAAPTTAHRSAPIVRVPEQPKHAMGPEPQPLRLAQPGSSK